MKPRQSMSAEARDRVSAATKAAMASPEIRARISAATKVGIQKAAQDCLDEIAALNSAWLAARPTARNRFLKSIIKLTAFTSWE